jgi:hypothetical protein
LLLWSREYFCFCITAKVAPVVFGAEVSTAFVPLAGPLVVGSGAENLELNFATSKE